MRLKTTVSVDLLVKVVISDLSPFELFAATATTVMLYWVPGIKLLIIEEVSFVILLEFVRPAVHWTVYETALPTGSVQFKDTDDVVTSIMVKFWTTAGSAKARNIQSEGNTHHLSYYSLFSIVLSPCVVMWRFRKCGLLVTAVNV